ncbi:hypothetical protein [Bacteroides sp. 224]|uniref:hypothetical protein n=1 Tax=Bacteroides sp. 224 TaxID=2302936 RepID=UPI0013CF6037|nr:hypothetical protein [Bacteroides sp. 224]NDV65977.1 hypothetical protein [Bacteroides sp. 224]
MKKYRQELLDNFTIEELESFNDEQIEKVSINGLKAELRMRESSKKEDELIKKFWSEEYSQMSFSDKIKYWGAERHQSMRWQEESGYPVEWLYTRKWLEEMLEIEPDFMKMLPDIYNMWGMSFDSEKIDKVIQELYKEIKG